MAIYMGRQRVSVIQYEKPLESVRRAVALAGGILDLPPGARVVIKPNDIETPKHAFENHNFPGMFMERYNNRPEFDDSFFRSHLRRVADI